ncbi:MAG: LON peptidase substrate-binding domain-containing protein, partial [Clostridia bacterium]|nr:LON peptidase substrate-binding domain-containing protein [Clostridia bacterium]
MAKYIEKVEQSTLPVIALRGAVAFPGVTLSFELTDELCIHAAEAAFETDSLAVICSVSDLSVEKLSTSALYRVGTVSKIKQSVKTPEGNMRIITEGYSRATVTEFHRFANYICADLICKSISLSDEESIKSQAYCRAILSEAEHLTSLLPSASDDLLTTARSIKSPALLSDFISSNILVKYTDKQKVLECFDPIKRIELLISLIREEAELLECEMKIHKKVRSGLNQNQKEFY